MNNYKYLKVYFNGLCVGTLARMKDYRVAFEYDKDWLNTGFSISPFSLPLKSKVFIPNIDPFNGLWGVFNDSLPDGWGRLLQDRILLKNKINPTEVDPLNRLAMLQDLCMGALEYKPSHDFISPVNEIDLDALYQECAQLTQTDSVNALDTLFQLGGSSGGARPKVMVRINDEDWLIKFPSKYDTLAIGEQEYQYSLCAKACGIPMPETRLFPSKLCSGFFGVKRFDRNKNRKIHMISAGGLLEVSHRFPNLDYTILMKATLSLTRNYQDIEQLFRWMCFNVFAHNRDDHAKNFAFLFHEDTREWHLSPAYDLTYSSSFNDEHATAINGESKHPDLDAILSVAQMIGLKQTFAKKIAIEIKDNVYTQLAQFLR